MGIIFFASRKKLLLKVRKNGFLILSATKKTKTQKLERNTLPREREMCERAKSERERKREGAGEGERARANNKIDLYEQRIFSKYAFRKTVTASAVVEILYSNRLSCIDKIFPHLNLFWATKNNEPVSDTTHSKLAIFCIFFKLLAVIMQLNYVNAQILSYIIYI